MLSNLKLGKMNALIEKSHFEYPSSYLLTVTHGKLKTETWPNT